MELRDAFAKDTELCLDNHVTLKSIFPAAAGGYADVYEGLFGDQRVAIKVVRQFASTGMKLTQEKLLRRLWREYLVWSRLSHPNVLPCLGYSHNFSRTLPSLISPWMINGNVTSYLEAHRDADRMKLLVDVADGLSYLHTQDPVIIHGDIRAGNILVSDHGIPCLTDFGLSRVLEEVQGMTTSSELAGSVRWMSPELFESNGSISVKSDIWAYGMTVLEILSGERPYSTQKNDIVVLGNIRDGQIPPRPENPEVLKVLDDHMWDTCRSCWSRDPAARPSMEEVTLMITPRAASKIPAPSSEVVPMLMSPAPSTEEPVASFTTLPVDNEYPDNLALSDNAVPDRIVHVKLRRVLTQSESIQCSNFSVDGKYLAVGTRHTVKIYDTGTGFNTCVLYSNNLPDLSYLCFSPNGKVLATYGRDQIWICEIETQTVLKQLNTNNYGICALEFSGDGHLLISAGGATLKHRKVRIWDMKTYQEKSLPIAVDFMTSTWSKTVAFSPNGHLIAVACGVHVCIWDLQKSTLVERLIGRVVAITSVAFTPDGKGLVSGALDGKIRFWDLTPFLSGLHIRRDLPFVLPVSTSLGVIEGRGENGSKCVSETSYSRENILRVAMAGDGQTVISSSRKGHVRFWDSATAKPLEYSLPPQPTAEGSVAISANLTATTGMLVTVEETTHSTKLWDYDISIA